jgi:hypothetical protein
MTISDVGSRANALVELSDPEGNRVAETAQGDGPVDALFAALSAATGVQLMLDSYQVHSVGIGADARGEASLSVTTRTWATKAPAPAATSSRPARWPGWTSPTACCASARQHDPGGRSQRLSSRDRDPLPTAAPDSQDHSPFHERSPRTLFDKLWDAHVVVPETDTAPAVLYIDLHLIHEVTSPQAFTELPRAASRRAGRTAPRRRWTTPRRPCRPARRQAALLHRSLRKTGRHAGTNCREHGIELFDMASPTAASSTSSRRSRASPSRA